MLLPLPVKGRKPITINDVVADMRKRREDAREEKATLKALVEKARAKKKAADNG
jgi:hypothetical protein